MLSITNHKTLSYLRQYLSAFVMISLNQITLHALTKLTGVL